MTGRPPKYRELTDASWLRARYIDDRLSMDEIAELCGFDCDRQVVRYWMRKHGIRARPAGRRSEAA